jgi:hypothetical protein
MGKIYEFNINPFQDFLFRSLIYDTDISDKEYEADIYVGFVTILEYFILNKDDIQYLDYEIKNSCGYYKVVGKNVISALWISGIFPKNIKQVLVTNEYILNNIKYVFNSKTKKLISKSIKK